MIHQMILPATYLGDRSWPMVQGAGRSKWCIQNEVLKQNIFGYFLINEKIVTLKIFYLETYHAVDK
jgi:hypothetical protein